MTEINAVEAKKIVNAYLKFIFSDTETQNCIEKIEHIIETLDAITDDEHVKSRILPFGIFKDSKKYPTVIGFDRYRLNIVVYDEKRTPYITVINTHSITILTENENPVFTYYKGGGLLISDIYKEADDKTKKSLLYTAHDIISKTLREIKSQYDDIFDKFDIFIKNQLYV